MPSVLWSCWLGGRKGIRPVKPEWWGAGMVICLERGSDLHTAQLMPLPLTVSCFNEIQIGFTFLVTAHPCSPGQKAVKRVRVCIYYFCSFLTTNTGGKLHCWILVTEYIDRHACPRISQCLPSKLPISGGGSRTPRNTWFLMALQSTISVVTGIKLLQYIHPN